MNRADARIALISRAFRALPELDRAVTVKGGDAAVRFLLSEEYRASMTPT